MTLRLTIKDHLKYLKQLKRDLKNHKATPLRKQDRINSENNKTNHKRRRKST